MADSKELVELLEHKIPNARQQLRDSHKNLSDLADYCERNYVESGQTSTALEETQRYAAQSLASVAYQVNVLAVGMLELLDKQMTHMGEMEANIHHISQVQHCLCVCVCVCVLMYVVIINPGGFVYDCFIIVGQMDHALFNTTLFVVGSPRVLKLLYGRSVGAYEAGQCGVL